MSQGRSIRIYLDGGDVSGIRYAELLNWTGQALLCPRYRLPDLSTRWRDEASRPGIYFLVGAEQRGPREVYIGESEEVTGRLRQHISKEFWQEAILFTSKDTNLTKAHVKYLEARLVARAREAKRYVIQNGNLPPQSELPRADRDAMEEFLSQIPLLLGVLGHRILDPIVTVASGSQEPLRLSYSVKGAMAFGAPTDEGFVIFKGSTALKGAAESMPAGWRANKEELIASGALVEQGSFLVFVEDQLFSSPSAAAAIVYGNNANGRTFWKAEDGRTLKEIEESETNLS